MLRSLLGFDWKKSDAHLLLLSKFSRPRQTKNLPKGSDWEDALREKPQKAIDRFVKDGYLEKSDSSYCLTSTGIELVEKYNKEKTTERKKTEALTIDALRNRKFKSASKTIADYEAKQVFPRGMGIDWSDYNTEDDEVVLSNIFNKKPGQLEKYNDKQLEPFRISAGMFHIAGWNRGDVSEWLSNNQAEQLDYEADEIALMIHSHATYLRDRDTGEGLGLIHKIDTCNDDLVCDECKKIASRVYYSTSELPTLPYKKCTSEAGCRCWLGSELDI